MIEDPVLAKQIREAEFLFVLAQAMATAVDSRLIALEHGANIFKMALKMTIFDLKKGGDSNVG